MSTTVTVCEYWRGPCQKKATHKMGRNHYCEEHYAEACDLMSVALVEEEEDDMLWPEERGVVVY